MALFLMFTHSHFFSTVGIASIVMSSITVMGLESRVTGFTQHNNLRSNSSHVQGRLVLSIYTAEHTAQTNQSATSKGRLALSIYYIQQNTLIKQKTQVKSRSYSRSYSRSSSFANNLNLTKQHHAYNHIIKYIQTSIKQLKLQ